MLHPVLSINCALKAQFLKGTVHHQKSKNYCVSLTYNVFPNLYDFPYDRNKCAWNLLL